MFEALIQLVIYGVPLAMLMCVGFWLGMRTTLKSISEMENDTFLRIMSELRSENRVDLSQFKQKHITRMIMSAHGDMILAHDHTTGQFIAQGKTSLELMQSALERFPDRVFMVAAGEEVVKS